MELRPPGLVMSDGLGGSGRTSSALAHSRRRGERGERAAAEVAHNVSPEATKVRTFVATLAARTCALAISSGGLAAAIAGLLRIRGLRGLEERADKPALRRWQAGERDGLHAAVTVQTAISAHQPTSSEAETSGAASRGRLARKRSACFLALATWLA